LRINNNLMALNTHRMLGINTVQNAKNIEKLSSGFRINRAGDDAAGLAISEKMRGQIRGLNQASRNSQDAISLIQTAEGAANETHAILQRMRELAVQSATDTNTSDDRSKLNDELVQLKSEVNRIAHNTEFNTQKLLNYGASVSGSPFDGYSQSVLDALNAKVPGWINDSMVAINARFDIAHPDSPVQRPMLVEYVDEPAQGYAAAMGTIDGSTLTLRINLPKVAPGGVLASDDALDALVAHEIMHAYQYTEMASLLGGGGLSNDETWFMEGLAMATQGGNGFITAPSSIGTADAASIVGAFSNSISDYASAYVAVKTLHEITVGGINAIIDELESGGTLDDAIANTVQQVQGEVDGTAGKLVSADFNTFSAFVTRLNAGDFDAYLSASTDFTAGTGVITTGAVAGSSSNLSSANTITNGTGTALVMTHYNLTFSADGNATSIVDTPEKFIFHIGANSGQSIELQTQNLTVDGLDISFTTLLSQASSNTAITEIDNAIQKVSGSRSFLGAVQNRLEHTIKNLDTSAENLQASESRIRDVDMAKEMMSFTKNNILQQAAQAMLAQANQAPQGVLQLLR